MRPWLSWSLLLLGLVGPLGAALDKRLTSVTGVGSLPSLHSVLWQKLSGILWGLCVDVGVAKTKAVPSVIVLMLLHWKCAQLAHQSELPQQIYVICLPLPREALSEVKHVPLGSDGPSWKWLNCLLRVTLVTSIYCSVSPSDDSLHFRALQGCWNTYIHTSKPACVALKR